MISIKVRHPSNMTIIYTMEEAKLSKTCSGREPLVTDPSALYQQCHDQLARLNQQLAHQISCERNAKLNRIIPSISTLNQQIQQIQTSINHQVTLEESTYQKQLLLQRKEALIKNIQMHSKKIEKYKRQMMMLSINHEELLRELEENKKIIDEKQLNFSAVQGKENEGGKLGIEKKQSLPSLFSHAHSRLNTNSNRMQTNRSSLGEEGESKWSKIDRLFDRLGGLPFNGLSKVLVELAKRESGTIKSVFRNYKANDKISQYVKSQEVRQQLAQLLKPRKK